MRSTPLSATRSTSGSAGDDTVSESPYSRQRPALPAMVRDEDFVGREHELGVLDALLAQASVDGARLALIRGAQGIGKT